MISPADIYHVVAATVPLYVALILAYISVKWWKLFTPQQCAGINKFVVLNPTTVFPSDLRKQPSQDEHQTHTCRLSSESIRLRCFDCRWTTPISGRLAAMYGDEPAGLLAQIVVLQSLIWYNLLLFMFEFNAAKPASEITPTSEDIEDTEAQGKEGEEEAETRASKSKIMLIFLTVEKEAGGKSQHSCSLAGSHLGRHSIQRSRIACGIRMTAVAMVMKFMAGPALIAASSAALGLRADY
ncbi:hypothetical protein Gohar_026432 [Gossypium harknessii]|uniref:Auxin efflux carrier component n=1 Tax=Gossypium harknessii TaxID=34285 RepID=A0A7J9HSW0_9ROSI|nr:hypothetical protein [Gossypium harknessii]